MSSRWTASRADRSLRMAPGSRARSPGLPPTRPRALADPNPALVRSAISARSNCATAPSTCSENMPCGVVVSMGSRRERKCAPLASNCSMTLSRCATERAKRSRRTTTRVSPGRMSRSTRASTGRSRSAPGHAPRAPARSRRRAVHLLADQCAVPRLIPWRSRPDGFWRPPSRSASACPRPFPAAMAGTADLQLRK